MVKQDKILFDEKDYNDEILTKKESSEVYGKDLVTSNKVLKKDSYLKTRRKS